MFRPYSSFPWRSSNGLRVKKTMPAFGALTKPLIESPGNCTAFSTPGCLRPMSAIWRITRSVRSSVAASGSWAKATRYCLSWVGTKPCGVLLNPNSVSASSPAYTTSAMPLRRMTLATVAP